VGEVRLRLTQRKLGLIAPDLRGYIAADAAIT
jgi:hypothetical protein